MKCGVVAEHERCHVVLPIQGGIVNKRAEIFGDHLVEHLSLAVSYIMPNSGLHYRMHQYEHDNMMVVKSILVSSMQKVP